jgi:signal transduction histidine kinase
MTQLAWLWTLLGILLAASSLASDAGAILAMVPEGQPRTHVYTDLARMQGLGISVISCLLLAEDWKTRGNRRLTAFFIVATIPGVIAWLSLMSRDSVDSSTVYYPGLLLALTALSFSAFPVYLGLRREGELDAVSLRVRHDTATLSREKDTLRSVEPLATIGSLSQLIAHEIRNPLSSITNSVSALRTGALKQSEQQTLIRILDKEADHIERLTSDLLVYSAPPSDALVRTCLWSLIERALVVANERNDERVTEFIQERPDPLLSALVDVQLLSASVQRMIDSALDVLSDTDRIRVSLSDNSQNVPKTIALTVAVEPSSSFGEGSGPSVTNPIDGTGIRFSIVEKAATFHYGEVNFTSPPTGPWKMVMILPQDPPNQEDS